MSIIHHYTTINNLALILKNKTIRFNRLDLVDDLQEAKFYGNYDLGKFLFVSCWTDSNIESIPLWHMYTDKMGHALSRAVSIFRFYRLVVGRDVVQLKSRRTCFII